MRVKAGESCLLSVELAYSEARGERHLRIRFRERLGSVARHVEPEVIVGQIVRARQEFTVLSRSSTVLSLFHGVPGYKSIRLENGGSGIAAMAARRWLRRRRVERDESPGLEGPDEPIPFLERSVPVTLEIAVRPSGEIRISEIVAVGGVDS